jgi:RPA family protein
MKRIANYLIVMALAVLTFTSCEDIPSPFGQIVAPKTDDGVVIEPSGKGTLADPYNVAGALEFIAGLGADVQSPTDVYIKGYVTTITEAFGTQYGNATFEISDTKEGANKFLCYRVKYFGGQGYSDPSATNIKEGDEVIICGKVVNYKGNTPETASNAAYVYSINGKGGGTTPTPTETLGTKDAPITVSKALEYINALADNGTTDKDAYVKGKITQIKTAEDKIAQYKNIDYIISDGSKELTVFRGKNLDNTDFTAAGQINVGDEVVVFGKLTKYVKDGNTTPEVAQGNYIVSLTKGSGGGGGEAKGTGTAADPFNIAAAIAKCKEVGTTASTEKYYIKGYVVKGGTASGGYGNVTFDMGDTKDATELFKAYQVAGTDGEKLADGYEVPAGAEVVIYGPVVTYKDTYETSGKSAAQIVTINGKKTNDNGGATGGDGADGSTVISIADFNAAAESDEVWYQLTGTVKNLKDGDQYGNFDLEDATGSVYVYGLLSEKGGAKKKFQDLVAKGVKNGIKITIVGLRSSYNGKIQVKNAYFIKIEEEGGGGGGAATGADGSTIISVADFNAAAESTDVWYQLTGTIKNLKDGDQYGNFDLEDSTGSVYVYGVLSEKGGAKKKFQDLVTGKGVANGKKITIVCNRGSYNGKIEVLNAYFIKVE